MATTVAIRAHCDSLAFVYRRLWGDHIHPGFSLEGNESPERRKSSCSTTVCACWVCVVASGCLSSLEAQMLTEQPELQAAKQEYEQAEQSVRIARYQRWPWFTVGPTASRADVENGKLINKIGVGFGIDLPILNFNQGEILRSEAERDRLYAAYVAKLHDRRADLNEAYRNLKAQEELVQIFQTTIQPALNENKELTEAAFQLKDLNLLQILTTQDRVLRSQSEFVSAELQYWESVFDLEKAVGAPISVGVKP